MSHTKYTFVSKSVLVGIVIGVFFAGLGLGYAVFTNMYSNPMSMMQDQQHMQTLLQNPEFMQKWTQVIAQNPSGRNYLGEQMASSHEIMTQMMQNQQFQQNVMNSMMDDPQMRQQMMVMMTQNPPMMDSMMNNMPIMNMLNNQTVGNNMNMQNPNHAYEVIDQMKQDHQFAQDVIMAMLNDPGLRLQVIGHMTENQEAMQQIQTMFNNTGSIGNMKNNHVSP